MKVPKDFTKQHLIKAIAEECEIPVILFDAPYNRMAIPNNVIRVENWMEAYQWVNQWTKENR